MLPKRLHVPDPDWINGPEEKLVDEEVLEREEEGGSGDGDPFLDFDPSEEEIWEALDLYERNMEGRE